MSNKLVCDKDRKWYNVTKFENFSKIIEDFHFCYLEMPKFEILINTKSKTKRN